MDEFAFISRLLAPLASAEGLGLSDDAALISIPADKELVVTKDALVEGVHFIGNETPGDLARKSLRVNLSDLAAMGATPYAYMLALILPAGRGEHWLRTFTEGLQKDQQEFGLSLIGGDTSKTPGPLSIAITMFGTVPKGTALRRNGARAGDNIYVSGTIGDAALGLKCAKTGSNPYLAGRYRLPDPRVKLGEALHGIATSCIDISDGITQDLEHICKASNIGAVLEFQHIPISEAAKAQNPAPEVILAGGDDYELLFTAPVQMNDKVAALSSLVPITLVGHMKTGAGLQVMNAAGKEITLAHKGYKHF